jgi:hypothetical protein
MLKMGYMTEILAGETVLNPTSYKIIKGNVLVQQAIFMVMLTGILLNTLQQPHAKEWVPFHTNNKTGFTLS